MHPPSTCLVEQDGAVVTLTLNNPDMRNAFLDEIHEGVARDLVAPERRRLGACRRDHRSRQGVLGGR